MKRESDKRQKTGTGAQAGESEMSSDDLWAQRQQTGAQIVVRSLIKQGVEVVFGYPGGQILDVYDELYKHSDRIKHVITAHEQGAAHAADGYARATGKVGVCISTSGPGATNLVTGIATAFLDSIPLVAITGNVATTLLGRDAFQETDIFGITIPVTKNNYIVKDVAELPGILAEAFEIARSGRPGPVLIDVPRDVQTAICDFSFEELYGVEEIVPVAESAQEFASATEEALEHAAALIASCERPFIYCGGGVLRAQAEGAVEQFAEHIDAVIGCSMMGLSAVPASHDRNLGMTGMHGREAAIRAKDRADLVIAIGVRFNDRSTGNKVHYTAGKKFIHIDIDPAEIDKNITTDCALVGGLKSILSLLTERLSHARRPDWIEEVAGMRAKEDARLDSLLRDSANRLVAQSVIRAVRAYAQDDTIVATDVGQHQMWVAQSYPFEHPRTFLTSGGLGTMGFGMGASIGGALSSAGGRGTKKVVLFTSDGSFGMNLNEMATAVSQKIPLVVVLINNGVLGMVRQWQTLFYGERYSNTILDRATDFVALARAFGADGLRVETPEALKTALEAAFAAEGPFLLECIIGKDDKVFPMIPPGGTVDDMMLAD